jgi:O-6-methylguanine DNA methyltransferase
MRSKNPIWRRSVSTAAGEFTAVFSAAGLRELHFPGEKILRSPPDSQPVPPAVAKNCLRLETSLKAILSGREPKQRPHLDWSRATPFQQSVWRELLAIPCGSVRTYGQIASALAKPLAARAVGTACGANPVPVLVPCHRVLAIGGGLGGFSGGLDWKRKLLTLERVTWGGAILANSRD